MNHLADDRKKRTGPAPISNDFVKQPPAAIEIEKGLLGILLLNSVLADSVFAILTPEHFYLEKNQIVAQTIRKLYEAGRTFDLITVWQQLVTDDQDKTFPAGPVELQQLTNTVTGGEGTAKDYARIVFQTWLSRQLLATGYDLSFFSHSEDPFELLAKTELKLSDLGARQGGRQILSGAELAFQGLKQIAENRARDTYLTGITTGFERLDKITRGWQPGNYIVLAARPSAGKTALALHFIRAAADAGNAVGFFSIEMKAEDLGLRMLAAISEVTLYRLQTGKIDDDQEKLLAADAGPRLAGMKIFVDDTPSLSLFTLRAKARQLVRRHGVKLLLIDYLQIMTPEETRVPREQQVGTLSTGVKQLGRELGVPIIILAQLGRGSEGPGKKQPSVRDIRESDKVYHDADVMLLLWGEDEEDVQKDANLANARYLKVAKQRDGEKPTLHLDFNGTIQKFSLPDATTRKRDPSRGPTWSPLPKEDGGDLFDGTTSA